MALKRHDSTAQCAAIPAHIKSKVSLIWAKKVTALYSPLSFNVIREVCQYLASRPVLIRVDLAELLVFDPAASQWRAVRTGISLNYTESAACVCIGDNQFFMCGGKTQEGRTRCASTVTFLIDCSRPTQLNSMRAGRIDHAVYYDEASLCVFAFGGTSSLRRLQRSCEQYDFCSGRWSPLSCMKKAKEEIQACGYLGKVFLSDIDLESLEVFTIATNQFTLISIQQESMFNCTVVAWKNQLIIFGYKNVQRLDVESYTLISEESLKDVHVYRKSAVVANNVLFTCNWRTCYSVDLETFHPGPSCEYKQDRKA